MMPTPVSPAAISGQPRLSLVAAVARDGVIGNDSRLPWHLPQDLAHFRHLTMGHSVLMGRKTWESLPERFRPLPGRRNLVLTRQPGWQSPGAEAVSSLHEAMQRCAGAPELFVIGGAAVYAAALPLADRLYLTEIDAAIAGDTHFPPWQADDYVRTAWQPQPPSADGLAFAFATYDRRR